MLGDLSEKERAEVEMNLSKFPDLKSELLRLEEVQEKLLMQTAINPDKSVKVALLENIRKRQAENVISVSQDVSNVNYWKYVAAASLLLAMVSSYLAYNYRNELQEARDNLSQYIAQNQTMAEEYNQVQRHLDEIEEDLRVINNPAYKRITLTGTGNAPQALAFVFWNADSREVYLRVQNMKQLARDNQYQLWAIVDGKPIDAGVFDASIDGLIRMKDIAGAATFAVTIEPFGGKEKPTLETMQVIGHVEAG
jgi:anti-sigma-K factor RskA